MIEILKEIDKDFLLETIDRDTFKKFFFANAKDKDIIAFVKEVLGM